MRQDDLENAFVHWTPEQVRAALDELERGGQVHIVERFGTLFWCAQPSYFPETKKGEKQHVRQT